MDERSGIIPPPHSVPVPSRPHPPTPPSVQPRTARKKRGNRRRSPRSSASPSSSCPLLEGEDCGSDPCASLRDINPHEDGGSGDGLPYEEEEEDVATPVVLLARRRLLRLVSTLALDRLQQIDTLNLFRDPVRAGAKGHAGAIKFPIDFATIRQRVQWDEYGSIPRLAADVRRMCANAITFNSQMPSWSATARCVLRVFLQRRVTLFFSKRRECCSGGTFVAEAVADQNPEVRGVRSNRKNGKRYSTYCCF